MVRAEPQERLLRKKDVADMLSCCTKTVERRTEKGTFTAYEIGGLMRYKKSEILAALKRKQCSR